jgi:imidazole glycerol phosphate synthase glutamine amidotransferase subunit
MTRPFIAVVDYAVGNHASVCTTLTQLDFRVRVTAEPSDLRSADVLVLPGVGAFPRAMKALEDTGLADVIKERAIASGPILGLCVGMQLLATTSCEFGSTDGLNLIPGDIVKLCGHKSHIGWNALHTLHADDIIEPFIGSNFYFNHSFSYHCAQPNQLAFARNPDPIPAIVRKQNIVGLQFHPEKSQAPGRELLRNLVVDLIRA